MTKEDKIQQVFTIIKKLNKLSVLRGILDTSVFKLLINMLSDVLNNNIINAEKTYYKILNKLFEADIERLSGSLFKDYIINFILTSENAFTDKISSDSIIDSLSLALENDINSLLQISELSAEQIALWCSNDSQTTTIALHSESKSLTEYFDASPEVIKCVFSNWQYEHQYLTSNCALITGYTVLTENEGTIRIAKLIDFYKSYGTGIFLKSRVLRSSSDKLFYPISDSLFEYNSQSINSKERDYLYSNAEAFINDEGMNTVVIGQEGSGKTYLIHSLINEYTNLHFICINGRDCSKLSLLFDSLAKQPINFIVLIDDAEFAENELSINIGTHHQPANVLVIAACNSDRIKNLFDYIIELPTVTPEYASDVICNLLDRNDIDNIKNICLDYQIETKSELSCKSIDTIIKRLSYSKQ